MTFYFSKKMLNSNLKNGNWSVRIVTTVSVVENWVPNPKEINIMKKRILHSWEIGILETASG